jgi:thioredoxin-dependent peroxiredoxin
MMAVSEESAAPEMRLEASTGKKVALKDLRGSWVVVYFYPKDDTPGCTREACSFRDNHKRLEALGAVVLGVSPDDLKAHDKFIAKYNLPFTLLADPDHEAAKKFGVWKEKNMYGKKVMGIERSTFLIDPDGNIRKAWRKVKVENHVDEVMDELKLVREG